MTIRECAIVEAYTGICMLTGDRRKEFYKYVEEIMGRPILTHELVEYEYEIEQNAKADFIELCKNATEEEPTSQYEDKEVRKIKIALFAACRNNLVLPVGLEKGKSMKEINKMSYDVMQTLLNGDLINWEMMEKQYKEGENAD